MQKSKDLPTLLKDNVILSMYSNYGRNFKCSKNTNPVTLNLEENKN